MLRARLSFAAGLLAGALLLLMVESWWLAPAAQQPSPAPAPETPAASHSRGYARPASRADYARLQRGSRAYCTGQRVEGRICRFEELCFDADREKFVFVHGPGSIMQGVPANWVYEGLALLASVERHNVLQFVFHDVQVAHLGAWLADRPVDIVDSPTHIFRRFKPDNIMHSIHDDLVPLFSTLRRLHGPHWRDQLLLAVDRLPINFGSTPLLSMLSSQPLLFVQNLTTLGGVICFANSHVGVDLSTTWYDYGFDRPQGPILDKQVNDHIVAEYVQFVRERLGLTATPQMSRHIVLFSRTRNRHILNESQLRESLRQRYKAKVTVVRMEAMTVAQIIAVISTAAVAVGMHGSILIFGLFLPPGALLVELFPYAVPAEQYRPYRTMAELPALRLHYSAWENRLSANSVGYPDRPKAMGGLQHLSPEEREQVLAVTRVPPHLCCSDPYWLYRIYQDTTVDVEAVTDLIDTVLGEDSGSWELTSDEASLPTATLMVPSRPQDIQCHWLQQGTIFRVSWRPSWNLAFLDAGIHYEIFVPETSRAYRSQGSPLIVKGQDLPQKRPELVKQQVTVWVRAVLSISDPRRGAAQETMGAFAGPTACTVASKALEVAADREGF